MRSRVDIVDSSDDGGARVNSDPPERARSSSSDTSRPGEVVWEPVVPNAVPGIWHRIEPMIKRSMQWNDFSAKIECIDDIYQALVDDQYGLWICTRDGHLIAAIIVYVAQYPRCSIVDICYGAGEEIDQWMQPFYDLIVDRARAIGARFIRIEGRPGWQRKLKSLGFQKVSEEFLLEI